MESHNGVIARESGRSSNHRTFDLGTASAAPQRWGYWMPRFRVAFAGHDTVKLVRRYRSIPTESALVRAPGLRVGKGARVK